MIFNSSSQRIYISVRTDSTPPASSKNLPTQPLPALSALCSILQLPDCLTAGGGRGWVGAVRSHTNIYSLILVRPVINYECNNVPQ